MNTTSSSSERSAWLVTGLAAASAILVFRLTGSATEFLFTCVLPLIDLSFIQWLRGWEFHVSLVLGLLLAMLGSLLQHRCLAGRPVRASYLALSVFVVIAVLPLRFEITVIADGPVEVLPLETDVSPVSLKCKVIDGEQVHSDVVFDHTNVDHAEPQESLVGQGYVVELRLDSAGASRLGEVTEAEKGKTLGFWIEGDLVSVGQIHEPISSGRIYVSAGFSHGEAARIAAGILASQ